MSTTHTAHADGRPRGTKQKGKAAAPPPRVFVMPEVEVGEIVHYQDGTYNPHAGASAAVVTEVGQNAIKVAIIAIDATTLRNIENDVRHKDDPEVPRLATVMASQDERETFGVWWRRPSSLSPEEVRGLRVLLHTYADELAPAQGVLANGAPVRDEFERGGLE